MTTQACFVGGERVADKTISWILPLYDELKIVCLVSILAWRSAVRDSSARAARGLFLTLVEFVGRRARVQEDHPARGEAVRAPARRARVPHRRGARRHLLCAARRSTVDQTQARKCAGTRGASLVGNWILRAGADELRRCRASCARFALPAALRSHTNSLTVSRAPFFAPNQLPPFPPGFRPARRSTSRAGLSSAPECPRRPSFSSRPPPPGRPLLHLDRCCTNRARMSPSLGHRGRRPHPLASRTRTCTRSCHRRSTFRHLDQLRALGLCQLPLQSKAKSARWTCSTGPQPRPRPLRLVRGGRTHLPRELQIPFSLLPLPYPSSPTHLHAHRHQRRSPTRPPHQAPSPRRLTRALAHPPNRSATRPFLTSRTPPSLRAPSSSH